VEVEEAAVVAVEHLEDIEIHTIAKHLAVVIQVANQLLPQVQAQHTQLQ
jgi:hypothetical protein